MKKYSSKISSIIPPLLFIVVAAVLCLAVFWGFIAVSNELLEDHLFIFDKVVMSVVYSWRNPLLTDFMKVITVLGYSLLIVLSTILVIVLAVKKRFYTSVIIAFTLIMGWLINAGLKNEIQRIRPQLSPLIEDKTFSYPSGHSMAAMIFYGCLIYLVSASKLPKSNKLTLNFLLILVISLVGLSRVYLGVHYPSDVLGGYCAGLIWLTIIYGVHHIRKRLISLMY